MSKFTPSGWKNPGFEHLIFDQGHFIYQRRNKKIVPFLNAMEKARNERGKETRVCLPAFTPLTPIMIGGCPIGIGTAGYEFVNKIFIFICVSVMVSVCICSQCNYNAWKPDPYAQMPDCLRGKLPEIFRQESGQEFHMQFLSHSIIQANKWIVYLYAID